MANPNFWYPKKYKNYAEKTRHLCLAEHGAYNLLLDHYYESRGKSQAFAIANGKANLNALYRVCMCQSDGEREAVASIVAQYFDVGSDGMIHNSSADEEITYLENVSVARSAAGKAGAEAKKNKANEQASDKQLLKQTVSKDIGKGEASNSNSNNYKNIEQQDQSQTHCRGQASTDVQKIFDYWKTKLNHPQAKLDAKREKAIKARLKDGYTVGQIFQAINGCSLSEYHMGKNDNNQKYDDLELICRDAGKVDRFIAIATGPPQIKKQEKFNPTAYINGIGKQNETRIINIDEFGEPI